MILQANRGESTAMPRIGSGATEGQESHCVGAAQIAAARNAATQAAATEKILSTHHISLGILSSSAHASLPNRAS